MFASPLESPLPVMFVGILVEVVLAVLYFQTRRTSVALAMLGVLALMFAGAILERTVVTERERVEAALDATADALEANDLDLVFSFLTDDAAHTRQRAAYALGIVRIQQINIRNLEIDVNEYTSPPTAEARFTGTAFFSIEDPQYQIGRDVYMAQFVVELRQEEGRWLITDHSEHERR